MFPFDFKLYVNNRQAVSGRYLDLMFWTCCSPGAFGYFEVTHDITQYCKAKVFEYIGKRTPIAIRFSTVGKAPNSLCVFHMCALRTVFALWGTSGCLQCFLLPFHVLSNLFPWKTLSSFCLFLSALSGDTFLSEMWEGRQPQLFLSDRKLAFFLVRSQSTLAD